MAENASELFARYNAPYQLSQFSSLMYLQVPPEFTYGGLLFYHLRDRGIHIWEDRVFVFTTAHTEQDEKLLLRALEDSLREMQQGGFLLSDSEKASIENASVKDMAPRLSPRRPWLRPAQNLPTPDAEGRLGERKPLLDLGRNSGGR